MPSTRLLASVCAAFGLTCAAACAAPTAPYYTITDLGTVDQVASDVVPGLSSNGTVTIWRLAEGTGYRPVAISGSTQTGLPAPKGYQNEFAYSINDHGDAVGWANTTLNPVDSLSTTHAVLARGDKAVDLGTLGGRDSRAYAINNAGVVVGVSQLAASRDQHAFRYSAGKMEALDPLDGGKFSIAFAVNDAGVVAGGAGFVLKGSPISPVHAVIWRGKKPEDLGVLTPGRSSVAYAINNHNDAVGVADTRTEQTVFLYSQGHMTDLDIDGRAYGINDNRQVVGTREGTERGFMIGWIWDNGVTYALNDCIKPKSGYWIEAGDKIDNDGVIVGIARLMGREHAVVLTPAQRP